MSGRSISRILSIRRVCLRTTPEGMVISLGRSSPPGSCSLPGTNEKASRFPPRERGHRPCLALLPVGVAWPPYYYVRRWSLTPPFHPCSCERYLSVAQSSRFLPEESPLRVLPGTAPYGVRTFLEAQNAPRPSDPPDRFIITASGGFVKCA